MGSGLNGRSGNAVRGGTQNTSTHHGQPAALVQWAEMADEDTASRDFQRTVEFMEYIGEAARRPAHKDGGRVA
jgi:hypothetical protein